MKHLVSRFGLALIFLCCAPVIRAQFADVTGGSPSFTLADPLSSLLEGRNIVAKVFTPAPFLGISVGLRPTNKAAKTKRGFGPGPSLQPVTGGLAHSKK